jgi:hypothetical protein
MTAWLLQDVADDLGLGEMGPALQEAEESRILTLVDGERLWFQHPLQAQVLERSLTSVVGDAGTRRTRDVARLRWLRGRL